MGLCICFNSSNRLYGVQCKKIFAASAAENAKQSPDKRFCFRYLMINYPTKKTSTGLCILFNSSNRLYRVQCSRIFAASAAENARQSPNKRWSALTNLNIRMHQSFLPGISNMCFCLTACELDINLRRSSVGITWNLTHILKNCTDQKWFPLKPYRIYVMCFHSLWQSVYVQSCTK